MNQIKKLHFPLLILTLLTCVVGFTSCNQSRCKVDRSYTLYEPVFVPLDEMRDDSKVISSAPREINDPGKIYFKDGYIYINERGQGIHVIDNADKSNPINIAFWEIPGNVDLAIRGNILFADSYIDLLSIDISNFESISIEKRVESALPFYFNGSRIYVDETQGILTHYESREVDEKAVIDCDELNSYPVYYNMPNTFTGDPFVMADNSFDIMVPNTVSAGNSLGLESAGGVSSPQTDGIGGSMARFTLYDDYLYTVSDADLVLFEIATPADPKRWATVNVGWNIETIFPMGDKLFIGSQSGMFIFDNSNPSFPTMLSEFQHARACDPVVAQDDRAYVTLRSNNGWCWGNDNQLDIIDITDLLKPELVVTYPMFGPYGLGVDGNLLFVCDGEAGLKVFDIGDELNMTTLAIFDDMTSFDVIPFNGVLFLIGEEGFYQYDYTDPANLTLLSHIAVSQ